MEISYVMKQIILKKSSMTINESKDQNDPKNNDDVKLLKVTKVDQKFLFALLKERDPNANISHRKMPSFKEHVKFVSSKPYAAWYIIKRKNQKVGSIYLSKQNEIGIFLKKNIQKHGIGKMALECLIERHPRSRYLANINPKNKKSRDFFIKNGFKLIQYTYERDVLKNFKAI